MCWISVESCWALGLPVGLGYSEFTGLRPVGFRQVMLLGSDGFRYGVPIFSGGGILHGFRYSCSVCGFVARFPLYSYRILSDSDGIPSDPTGSGSRIESPGLIKSYIFNQRKAFFCMTFEIHAKACSIRMNLLRTKSIHFLETKPTTSVGTINCKQYQKK